MIFCIFFYFFFSSRRRHTRFKCDWSSDVCSSDVEGRNCGKRFRLDDLPKGEELAAAWRAKKLDLSGVPCPNCGERKLADPRQFNLMFKTFVGPVEDTASIAWLRPETAQSIFVDF